MFPRVTWFTEGLAIRLGSNGSGVGSPCLTMLALVPLLIHTINQAATRFHDFCLKSQIFRHRRAKIWSKSSELWMLSDAALWGPPPGPQLLCRFWSEIPDFPTLECRNPDKTSRTLDALRRSPLGLATGASPALSAWNQKWGKTAKRRFHDFAQMLAL
jgi:hypothetical protein